MVFENKMQTVAFLDHVYLVHPSTDISVDISVMIPADTRPMYQPRCRPSDGRHIDRLLADISVHIAVDTRPIR